MIPSFLRKNPSGGAPFSSSSPARSPSAAMGSVVKKEAVDAEPLPDPMEGPQPPFTPLAVIDLSSSDDSDSDDDEGGEDVSMFLEKKPRLLDGAVDVGGPLKKMKSEDGVGFVLPLGFLDPLPQEGARAPPTPLPLPLPTSVVRPLAPEVKGSRQFWKAGDYEGDAMTESVSLSAGIEHVRVHPKFLHSNATSHKWALGAIAELLDNAVDEVCNGATFVNVDVLENKKDMSKLLLVEDNGGGMDPDKMRQCMSLGYSAKSKSANTIGQYGNGFKTSTMRLGADVIVFSRCHGKGGKSSMQSIGMLSYTFLRDTGKEDIVVPMIDYEKRGENWNKLVRSSTDDWNKNLETIMQWSPYSSEDELLHQFGSMSAQGTRIIIYNLWEDDQLQLELDFVSDTYDIQVRGVNRDEKKIQMAKQFPNSRHFLTYRHSLRSYASILYLRLPQDFKMILRGKEIEHHNIVNDMMIKQEVTYKPQTSSGTPRDPNMVAVVTIGFVKDAKDHIDVQGFNVYHKNRLIKPFWRVWNTAGSGGRGVIGVLEANFIEPAHDKQDFERTTVLARLETRLIQMQKNYWGKHSHLVGYAGKQTKNKLPNDKSDREISPEAVHQPSPRIAKHSIQFQASSEKGHRSLAELNRMKDGKCANGHITSAVKSEMKSVKIPGKKLSNSQEIHNQTYPGDKSDSNSDNVIYDQTLNASNGSRTSASNGPPASTSHAKETSVTCNGNEHKLQNVDVVSYEQLKYANHELKDRLKKLEEQRKSLAEKLSETEKKMEEVSKEQEALIDIFSEERSRRDMEEENLRKKLKEASDTIQQLLEKSYNRSNTRT